MQLKGDLGFDTGYLVGMDQAHAILSEMHAEDAIVGFRSTLVRFEFHQFNQGSGDVILIIRYINALAILHQS